MIGKFDAISVTGLIDVVQFGRPVLFMAAPRNLMGDTGRLSREENADEDDSPSGKKPKLESYPLNRWEFAVALTVFFVFSAGLSCVYLTMPAAEYGKLKLPRTISDLRMLKDHFATYAKNHAAQFILGYCSTYIFMQTFMIPGTIFMSLLAGALFGVVRGILLVVFNATAGASSCFFLSKLIGRPLVSWLWPEKLRFFQVEIAKRRDKLLNYMLFLRITPTLPNLFINLASPIVDIPFHVFFLATLIGLIPASYITVRFPKLSRSYMAFGFLLSGLWTYPLAVGYSFLSKWRIIMHYLVLSSSSLWIRGVKIADSFKSGIFMGVNE